MAIAARWVALQDKRAAGAGCQSPFRAGLACKAGHPALPVRQFALTAMGQLDARPRQARRQPPIRAIAAERSA